MVPHGMPEVGPAQNGAGSFKPTELDELVIGPGKIIKIDDFQ